MMFNSNKLYHKNITTQQGFSLIELLVVVSIIAIIVGSTMLTYAPTQPSKRVAMGEQLLTLLKSAQKTAISERLVVAVHIAKKYIALSRFSSTDENANNAIVYADIEKWQEYKKLEIIAKAGIDYANELKWRIKQDTTIIEDDEKALPLPSIIIFPTGQIYPEGVIDLLATDNDLSNDIAISWENSELKVKDELSDE